MELSEDYLRGYKDGMDHISAQVDHINDQMNRLNQILTKAVFAVDAKNKPRPGLRLWLVLDPDSITTGYYLSGKFISDAGCFVEPTHWCLIPPSITGEVRKSRRRIVKGD